MSDPEISDNDRYPTLSDDGRRLLDRLREHPNAPIYRNQSGNRLLAEDVDRVRAFEREVLSSGLGWGPDRRPRWLGELVAQCYDDVPFYRRQGSAPSDWNEVPTLTRADLAQDIARFVPDSVALDRLINFRTSGTTGHPLLIASHPVVAASYLAFHKKALRRFGITLTHGRGQVGVVLLGWQKVCFTYVSVTPTQDESGLAKINLHPDDWRRPGDRAAYLDALATEVYAGDPISLAELLELPLTHQPRALLSTSMALSVGLRQRLEERFHGPVLDLYSLNEAGPVAVFDPAVGGHVLLQHCLYLEILDQEGRPLPPGERGEVTLSGGFNFCLPLLRYRTGDHAALRFVGDDPVLLGLEGRPPVRFRTASGQWVNNIEVTHALRPYPLSQFGLHQAADGSLRLRLSRRSADEQSILSILHELFGAEARIEIVGDPFDDKVVQYTSDLEGAEA